MLSSTSVITDDVISDIINESFHFCFVFSSVVF